MNKSQISRPSQIGLLMTLIALLVPFAYHLDLNPYGWNSIEAVVWRYVESLSRFSLFDNTIHLLPYYVVNFLFIIQMIRYCQGRTNRTRTVIVGIYAQLHPLLLSLPVLFGMPFTIAPGGEVMYPVVIPIPILLLLGIALIHLKPVALVGK
ncbi:MAG: hypothetical protein EAX95_01230 [Candidatus Thorarchaeota archaeon]|nr:hypothetical protein [Candidatus Thorarchaeota archaeon]